MHSASKPYDDMLFKCRKGLGLIHLNIKSLFNQSKLDDVKVVISLHIDNNILVLTETWLKQSIRESEVSLHFYNM